MTTADPPMAYYDPPDHDPPEVEARDDFDIPDDDFELIDDGPWNYVPAGGM